MTSTVKALPSKNGQNAGDDPVLRVNGITVGFGGIRAVDDVSFDAGRGSILGLIGPNGAGKTTLFDAICGIVEHQQGRIELEGKDITGLPPSERSRSGLGRSFQDARLFPSLTVVETLSCALERTIRSQDPLSTVLGMPWVWTGERQITERVEELIAILGLDAFRDKFISELSTGSRRIVDLACVLAHAPTVLLLDEPSSGIAQRETEALAPLLLRVKDTLGCTMLLIEHDMPLVTSVSDELIALETGRVIARGTPKEVTNNPAVVEAYLGTDQRIVTRSGRVVEVTTPKGRPNTKKRPTSKAASARRAAGVAKSRAKKSPKAGGPARRTRGAGK